MLNRLFYILLFCLAGFTVFAQQYPVQGSLAIASPYSCNLSDYANNNMQNLALNLTLTDISAANKRVRLKLFIQTQNAVIAQSTDNVQGEPVIMLDGGIPQRFTNAELAPYFRLENLQGITSDAYARSLPEGVYTIGIEVYDYFTGNRLSGRIGQTFWLIINDPPLLNTPADKSKVSDFLSPLGGAGGGLVFNWTPRSTQVSNTEYEFTLCELWDPQGDPYQQFMAAIPKYKTTVSNTSTLIYTQANPPLQSGYWYAWRVRAKAKSGFEDVGLYRNDGYSNLYTFRYGDPCPAPQNLRTEVKSHDQVNLTWDAPANSSPSLGGGQGEAYKVFYRKYNLAGSYAWAETTTNNTFCNLTNLEPATEYEFKVGVVCNAVGGSTSPLVGEMEGAVFCSSQRATTLDQGKIAGVECGKEPVIDISNKNLLPLLKVNDVVTAGDFPVTIFKVSGTQAGWNGEGWVRVPWLADTRIHVTFSGIQVNTDHKLIAGSFNTVYNPKGKNISDVDEAIADAKGLVTGGTDVGKVVTGADATASTVPYTITPANIAASTFTPNTTGGGTITLAEGKTIDVASVPTTVQDGAGNIYQADKDGKLSKVGSAAGNGATLVAAANLTVVDGSKGTVIFAPTNETKYAFDSWQKTYDNNGTWKAKYESLTVAGGGQYRVSSKLMVPDEADKVLAMVNFRDKSLSPDSIRFVNGKGTRFETRKITDTSFELSLVGGPAGDAQEIYALYPITPLSSGEGSGVKCYTLGKLLVASYQPRAIKLSLVPVNGTALNEDAIRDQLNVIYEPLGIDFDISVEDNFEYAPLRDTPLKVEGSGLLSVYTDQMKALNNAFMASGNYENGTIYLFVLPQGADKNGNTKGLEGDMPRGQQFGYLFAEGLTDQQLAQAAAHEVGHGVFQLQHTFSYSGIKQGALPANIMDYADPNSLSFGEGRGEVAKLQWDLIHDPGLVIGVFETDKGGELSKETDRQALIRRIFELRNAYQNHKKITISSTNKEMYSKIVCLDEDEFVTYDFLKLSSGVVNNVGFAISSVIKIEDKYASGISLNNGIIKIWCPTKYVDALYKFFIKEQQNLLPHNPNRKAFFIHGTANDDNSRWLENPLTLPILMKLCGTSNCDYSNNLHWDAPIYNNFAMRAQAAEKLAKYILSQTIGIKEIVLIGHSHGGNVAIQIIDKLVGKKVYLITIATPAYNNPLQPIAGRNSECIDNIKSLEKHIALWNKVDGVSGGFAGDDYFTNNFTLNIKIDVSSYFKNNEFYDAHSFDIYHPQSIKKAMNNGTIPKF